MKLNDELFKAFAMEIATFGNIPISSQPCGIGCVFCKVNCDSRMNRFPALPQIDEEDLRAGFRFVKPDVKYVRLGAGVLVAPHTDPYLHPKAYDFIRITAEHFPEKQVTTVTTGSYIDESRLDFLRSIPNFGIDLSLLTLQSCRERLMALPTRAKVMRILREAPLNKVTLMFTGEIDELKRDLDLLYGLGVDRRVRQILVRRIEHTKESNRKLLEVSSKCIVGYERAIAYLNANYPAVVYTVPYLNDSYRGGNNEYFIDADERIVRYRTYALENLDKRLWILCAESGYEYFFRRLSDLPNVRLCLIRNHLYGGSVTVAGLLNHQDIREQFHPDGRPCDIIVLPKEMYNADGCDLTGEPMRELAAFYRAEVHAL